jgi:hypothetical protein
MLRYKYSWFVQFPLVISVPFGSLPIVLGTFSSRDPRTEQESNYSVSVLFGSVFDFLFDFGSRYFVARATRIRARSLFGWLVADGWCWFVLREEYCWLVAGG